jgi:hypothetical protein
VTSGIGRRPWISTVLSRFVVRRERLVLTWPARLLAIAILAALVTVTGRELGSFLTVTSPVGADFMVVEAWMPTFAFREAAAVFHKGAYRKAIAAGTLDWDEDVELRQQSGGDRLVRFGIPRDQVAEASSDGFQHDRTFHAAMAVKQLLREKGLRTVSVDLVTIGAHARRSRLLYQLALGPEIKVGVIAIKDRRFDVNHWWRSSPGVRAVMGEGIAYLYAKLFFLAPI